MINLQDRTSWKEFIRCKALEEMQKNAEFNPALVVVTLAKDTDFYSQTTDPNGKLPTDLFLSQVIKQFEAAEGHGLYFPPSAKPAELCQFVQSILPIIHRHFFEGKKTLARREREDLIEILYQFVTLKLIDQYAPATMSFTCKDGIDTGAAASALFYAFIQLLKGHFAEKKEIDYFRWLLYAPSLFVRERPLDVERFNRVLTALERVDGGLQDGSKALLRDLEGLYSSKFLASLEVG
jgi:hypothetical protein